MNTEPRTGAIGALLSEYGKAVKELQAVIAPVTDAQLTTIADEHTENPECRSIQTVLTHVVSSGFSYAVYIGNLKDDSFQRPERKFLTNTTEYAEALNEMLAFTATVLARFDNSEVEFFEEDKKIFTKWGQHYDIEQMLEHAIVHILRHRLQIERFIVKLS